MELLTFRPELEGILKGKSPLRGQQQGHEVFYWFREDDSLGGELTTDNVLIDKDCQLPVGLFALLPIDNLVNDITCLYWSKEAAWDALYLAVERFENKFSTST